ncbi:isopentenyl phosphate kinase family protein [Candidatus Bathyarchaeota archaeon]|nr:isopentenyl phosphate kinase family protein [Candidatus Bathyarchaeota archaeon]
MTHSANTCSPSKELIVLKLGGSAITRKDGDHLLDRPLVEAIAKELAGIDSKLILVHGAGSFGHPVAKRYGIHQGYRERGQLRGVTETKSSMLQLTMMLTELLADHNVAVIPFLSSSCMVASRGRLLRVDTEPFRMMLDLGFVPLCSGDVVADVETGFSIVSGDQIAVYLAERLNAARVIFGCDVDGVFDSDPKMNPHANLIRVITPRTLSEKVRSIGESAATDVTKGMLGKINESVSLVSVGREVVILNLRRPGNLTRLIQGEDIECTRFIPDSRGPTA